MMHSDPGLPLVVGDRVSVGHGAILTAAKSAMTFSSAWAPPSSTVPGSAKGR